MKSHQIKRIQPFSKTKTQDRGWTLDVLNAIRRLTERGSVTRSTQLRDGTNCDSQSRAPSEFTTAEVYAFTRELEQLHPDNRHVRDKIRQQLQVLRDSGLLVHVERGRWQLP